MCCLGRAFPRIPGLWLMDCVGRVTTHDESDGTPRSEDSGQFRPRQVVIEPMRRLGYNQRYSILLYVQRALAALTTPASMTQVDEALSFGFVTWGCRELLGGNPARYSPATTKSAPSSPTHWRPCASPCLYSTLGRFGSGGWMPFSSMDNEGSTPVTLRNRAAISTATKPGLSWDLVCGSSSVYGFGPSKLVLCTHGAKFSSYCMTEVGVNVSRSGSI